MEFRKWRLSFFLGLLFCSAQQQSSFGFFLSRFVCLFDCFAIAFASWFYYKLLRALAMP
jgi:hypothetical protein